MTTQWGWPTWDEDVAYYEPQGSTVRVAIERQRDHDRPEFEAGDPIFHVENAELVYGGRDGDGHVGVEMPLIISAMRRWNNGRAHDERMIERYIRVFLGGEPEWISSEYLAVALPSFRARHGCTGDELTAPPQTEEWQAYLDGDVWGVYLQYRCDTWVTVRDFTDVDGATITTLRTGEVVRLLGHQWRTEPGTDSWGIYGERLAKSEALSLLPKPTKEPA